MHTTQATSIWKRPLKGHAFAWAFAVLGIAAVLAYVYPLYAGIVNWSLHRKVTYWGATFTMPFRWVYDSTKAPLVFKHTGLPSLTLRTEGDLSATKSFTPIKDGAGLLQRRDADDDQMNAKLLPFGYRSIRFILPANNFGGKLHCSQREGARSGIMLDCITEDTTWTFLYDGPPEYLPQAESIMTTLKPESRP